MTATEIAKENYETVEQSAEVAIENGVSIDDLVTAVKAEYGAEIDEETEEAYRSAYEELAA